MASGIPRGRRRRTGEPIGREALFAAIYEVVEAIPRGRVATYGQVAELAGLPGGARVAAAAMRLAPKRLPWHRVVGKRSRSLAAIRILDPIGAALQRERLETEGVRLSPSGGIRLADHGWLP
jgi:methylated-DNA-protein-cysteine methyltransferase related protein